MKEKSMSVPKSDNYKLNTGIAARFSPLDTAIQSKLYNSTSSKDDSVWMSSYLKSAKRDGVGETNDDIRDLNKEYKEGLYKGRPTVNPLEIFRENHLPQKIDPLNRDAYQALREVCAGEGKKGEGADGCPVGGTESRVLNIPHPWLPSGYTGHVPGLRYRDTGLGKCVAMHNCMTEIIPQSTLSDPLKQSNCRRVSEIAERYDFLRKRRRLHGHRIFVECLPQGYGGSNPGTVSYGEVPFDKTVACSSFFRQVENKREESSKLEHEIERINATRPSTITELLTYPKQDKSTPFENKDFTMRGKHFYAEDKLASSVKSGLLPSTDSEVPVEHHIPGYSGFIPRIRAYYGACKHENERKAMNENNFFKNLGNSLRFSEGYYVFRSDKEFQLLRDATTSLQNSRPNKKSAENRYTYFGLGNEVQPMMPRLSSENEEKSSTPYHNFRTAEQLNSAIDRLKEAHKFPLPKPLPKSRLKRAFNDLITNFEPKYYCRDIEGYRNSTEVGKCEGVRFDHSKAHDIHTYSEHMNPIDTVLNRKRLTNINDKLFLPRFINSAFKERTVDKIGFTL